MNGIIIDIFGSYGRIIVFLHVVSACFLIGSMVAIRFIVKPVIMNIDEEIVRYKKCIRILDRYSYFVLVIMLILISASFMMNIGLGFEYTSPSHFATMHVKEALWVFIAFNFVYMYIKFVQAKKFYGMREFFDVHENLSLVVNYLMPLNIILSLIASYLGVILRGF